MSITETSRTSAAKTTGFDSGEWMVLLFVALFVVVVGAITALFGLPGLAMSALTMVPIVYAVLILITVGK
ncbi:hypothetical protein ACN2XU_07740 [Primorskyibacter sp. 2E107]|uniref:hypothetical protein n=1 Tax=Primorskyibacter sp. 2E107 TaxID=3403458 RepID=UPI003AF698D6